MSSKVTEALKQLNHSVNTLRQGYPAIDETIEEKKKQIKNLRKEYFVTNPNCLSGTWNMYFAKDFHWIRLSGWAYDNENFNSKGTDEGNALFDALGFAVHDEWYTEVVRIPYKEYDENSVQDSFCGGKIDITLYDMDMAAVIAWISERNIEVKFPDVDSSPFDD